MHTVIQDARISEFVFPEHGGHAQRVLAWVWEIVSWRYLNYTNIYHRSPRWTSSGSPRMLLVLVREFESRRGEILNLIAKIEKGQLLRVPSVGNHNSTRVDEGRKS